MRKNLILVAILWIVGGYVLADVSDLRIYSMRDACFEYKFTSVVTKSDHDIIFSLNHLHGRTHFVKLGDTIGPYCVKDYKPDTKKVYKPSLKSYQTVDAGVLTLENRDGSLIPLQLNKVMPADGRMVCVISLASGRKQYARSTDRLILDGKQIRIMDIDDNHARVFAEGSAHNIEMISDDESTALRIMQLEEKRRKEEADRLAKQEAIEKERRFDAAVQRIAANRPVLQPRQKTVAIYGQPHFAYGAGYPIPIDYQVVPIWGRMPNGRQALQPIVVPTRFRTYQSGIDISRSGLSFTYCR